MRVYIAFEGAEGCGSQADYRPIDVTGLKSEETLRVLKNGLFDIVSIRTAQAARDEPFLLGANIPVVVPAKPARARPVENLIRRRFRHRLPPGGRAVLSAEPLGVAGEALIAGLALAIPIALLRTSKNPLIYGLPWIYIYFFRGTPLSGITDSGTQISPSADG